MKSPFVSILARLGLLIGLLSLAIFVTFLASSVSATDDLPADQSPAIGLDVAVNADNTAT